MVSCGGAGRAKCLQSDVDGTSAHHFFALRSGQLMMTSCQLGERSILIAGAIRNLLLTALMILMTAGAAQAVTVGYELTISDGNGNNRDRPRFRLDNTAPRRRSPR